MIGSTTAYSPLHAQNTPASGGAGASVRAGEPVTLNFANAEIEAVARTMATITGRNVVVDPRVRGMMNLTTERAVSPAVAFDQFLAALRLQGFTVVESAGLYKVVPEADAKLQSGGVSVMPGSSRPSAAGNQIVTQIFKLNFESANNLVPVLRPLISPNNTINVNPGNNSLVITDYSDNLQRLGKIIAAMDMSNASDVEVIPLANAIASDLAPLVVRLIESSSGSGAGAGAGQADTSFRTTLIAEPRSNSLVLRAANPARVRQVRALVEKLDQPPVAGSSASYGNIHVVYLKNADAVKLAVTLRAALGGSGGGGGGGSSGGLGPTNPSGGLGGGLGGGAMGGNSGLGGNLGGGQGLGGNASGLGGGYNAGSQSGNSPSTGGMIQADPSTNSLVITAPDPVYRQLREVIDKLDGRRAQVLVESLIIEVSADKAAEFGIQWQSAIGKSGDGTVGVLGTNSSLAGANIIDLAVAAATGKASSARPSTGFNLGIAPRINGKYVLGLLARFLENNGDANVLSTPNLLTLDNEEASIIVGSNVPFVTGQYGSNNAGGTVNPFTTVERKDVGLTLRVRPQINENGTVKLSIYQEDSSVDSRTANNLNGPITKKRAIQSNVLVEDGAIVVLGGLLQDTYEANQEQVPVLGDIPLLGNLFKSQTRRRAKTNLMVFLRPVVVRDAAATESLSMDRYDMIRGQQQSMQPADNIMMRAVPESPLLPPLSQEALRRRAERARQVPEPLPPVQNPAATARDIDLMKGSLPSTSDPSTNRPAP